MVIDSYNGVYLLTRDLPRSMAFGRSKCFSLLIKGVGKLFSIYSSVFYSACSYICLYGISNLKLCYWNFHLRPFFIPNNRKMNVLARCKEAHMGSSKFFVCTHLIHWKLRLSFYLFAVFFFYFFSLFVYSNSIRM